MSVNGDLLYKPTAAWGGAFWAGLPIVTSLWESDPPPHATLATVLFRMAVAPEFHTLRGRDRRSSQAQ